MNTAGGSKKRSLSSHKAAGEENACKSEGELANHAGPSHDSASTSKIGLNAEHDAAEHQSVQSLDAEDTDSEAELFSEKVVVKPAVKSRGGRRKRPNTRGGKELTFEELLKKQETASQIHNENERFRRKELKAALYSLREQLTIPTKRPAVKLVLAAAIEELKKLEEEEQINSATVESLKDNEKRLSIELENKLKEFKTHKASASGHASGAIVNGPQGSSAPWRLLSPQNTPRPFVAPAINPPLPFIQWPPLVQAPPPVSLSNSPINIASAPVTLGNNPINLVPNLHTHNHLRTPQRLPIQHNLYPSLYQPQLYSNNLPSNSSSGLPLQLATIGGHDHRQIVTILPNTPQLFTLPGQPCFQQPLDRSANEDARHHLMNDSDEADEISVTEDEVPKNGGESVEPDSRPSSVPYYTISTDSKQVHKPAHTSSSTASKRYSYCEDVFISHSKKKLPPPLIKIDSQDALRAILNRSKLESRSGLKTPKKKSFVGAVKFYSSPYYKSSREHVRYARNGRWQDIASETDSDGTGSEDNDCLYGHSGPLQVGIIACPAKQ